MGQKQPNPPPPKGAIKPLPPPAPPPSKKYNYHKFVEYNDKLIATIRIIYYCD